MTIYVFDQDRAKQFYVDKLGCEVRTDVNMGSFRWLTVAPRDQDELELVLMPIDGPAMTRDAKDTLRELVSAGKLAPGVFATRDCRQTYAELKARGVEFKSEPAERPYGIEAMFVDDSGNLFSLTQRT
ncbi:MAG: VOC family protein [Polyangiales bacterium]